jgi:amidase
MPRPANHNAVALILPHKAMLDLDGGAIGADAYCDRSGIRTIADCVKVLDALQDPNGLLRPARFYTTVPRSSVLPTAYAFSHSTMPGTPGALSGKRIGIVRESMLVLHRRRCRSSPPPPRRSRRFPGRR